MAAFWSVLNDEEPTEGKKAAMLKTKMASQMEIQKEKSDLLLLQRLSMTTGSTKCTSSDHQDDFSDCVDVSVKKLQVGGGIGFGFRGEPKEPEEPEQPSACEYAAAI